MDVLRSTDLMLAWVRAKPEEKAKAWDEYTRYSRQWLGKSARDEASTRLNRRLEAILNEELRRFPANRKLSKVEWMLLCERIAQRASVELSDALEEQIKAIYLGGVRNVVSEFGKNTMRLNLGGRHAKAIETAKAGIGLADTFANFSDDASTRLKNIVVESFKAGDVGPGGIVGRMVDEVGWRMRSRLEMIARTETHKVWESARMNTYTDIEEERGEKFLYRFGKTQDHKTCDICTEIMGRTRNGVTMEELRDIIIEISTRGRPSWDPTRDGNFPLAHPSCRHSSARIQSHLDTW